MRSGNLGGAANWTAALVMGVAAFIGLPRTVSAQQIHRNGFESRQTGWLRGEDNIRAEEKEHRLSSEYAHQGSASEYIQLICPEGKNENNVAAYYYPTQPAPITEDLIASVWVKANRAGVQLQARLVLPHERNPKQLDEPLTMTLYGDIYRLTRRWQKLDIANPVKLLKDQQQILRAQMRRDVDLTDAYIDRLILNLYVAPGQIDVYIDDLEVGPVRPQQPPPPVVSTPAANTRIVKPKLDLNPPGRTESGIPVRMENDKLTVGGKPFFFRAVRYSDTPLKTLRDAGFNTVWFDSSARLDTIEEAANQGFWIIPRLSLVGDQVAQSTTTSVLTGRNRNANDLATARDAEGLATAITRFLTGDAVLFWDLGGALQLEKADSLQRTAAAVSLADPQRPLAADVWDGFHNLSHFVSIVGTHRYPLMSSLELTNYRDWLAQRRHLTSTDSLHWTWIQTHIPDWQMRLIYGKSAGDTVREPIGPQPEQIRLLTYLGMAAGCKGLAFSSDRFLADSHQGRDRLLMLALLNQEIHMLEPILLSVREKPVWIDTSDPQVKAAVLRSDKGILVLPVWLGEGAQYVSPQGSVANLQMVVPLIPDGAQAWEVSPSRVQSMEFNTARKLGGTLISIPEFDTTAAIVFTSDLTPQGLVTKWQNHSRLVAPQASQWAIDLATVQLQKVRKTHAELVERAPAAKDAERLLHEAEERLEAARRYERSRDYANAHQEALRAMRPLRILMRTHWVQAVRTLDIPSASPFAVSFFTLPRHWDLHHEIKNTRLGPNALPTGDFELVSHSEQFLRAVQYVEENRKTVPVSDEKAPPVPQSKTINAAVSLKKGMGVPVTSLPGWNVQSQTLDAVDMDASFVPSDLAKEERPEKKTKPKRKRYDPSTGPIEVPEPPQPKLGESVMRLTVSPKRILSTKDSKPLPAPAALERTFLAVSSPQVNLTPGTWVRICAWVRISGAVQASADGFLLFDNVGEEAMGVRITSTNGEWKRYCLYRQVPPSGIVWATAALTGIGSVFVDDVKIEPLVAAATHASGVTPAAEPPLNSR